MPTTMIKHQPVMVREALEHLKVSPGGVYVDCTVGLGGHSSAILESLSGRGTLIAIDRDQESLEQARSVLMNYTSQVSLHHENYKNLSLILHRLGVDRIDGCLLDLGVSRFQLTSTHRGFSFRETGPLDMRMDLNQQTTAGKLVNHLSVDELSSIFKDYGEETDARRIASAIVERRQQSPIQSTTELALLVSDIKRGRTKAGLHPATQVFQALRIAVNRELEGLDEFLAHTIQFLRAGARIVVISFHSLEDRVVKRVFNLESGKCICFKPRDLCRCPRIRNLKLLTRRPQRPSDQEIKANPSARSARLRAAERTD